MNWIVIEWEYVNGVYGVPDIGQRPNNEVFLKSKRATTLYNTKTGARKQLTYKDNE